MKDMLTDASRHVKDGMLVGLGSGSTVSLFLDILAERVKNEGMKVRFIPTSMQIKFRAESLDLNIADDSLIPYTDIVFDGADQIDSKLNMIKGGGGALLREKILIHASKKTIILADEKKYVDKLKRSVPIEVLPFARSHAINTLKRMNAKPVIRSLEKGYPFVTENGNIILDTEFGEIDEPEEMEHKIKCIAGVLEVGIFSKRADIYYISRDDGTFRVIK